MKNKLRLTLVCVLIMVAVVSGVAFVLVIECKLGGSDRSSNSDLHLLLQECGVTDSSVDATNLVSHHLQIRSLEGVDRFAELVELDIPASDLESLEPLRGLVKIKHLRVSSRNLSSLEPLGALAGLEKLIIEQSDMLQDISALASCTNLRELRIGGGSVGDLSALRNLHKLQFLHVVSKVCVDLSDIDCMEDLIGLTLQCPMYSVNDELQLPRLRWLCLSVDGMCSIVPFVSNMNVETIRVSMGEMDLSWLLLASACKEIDISSNSVVDCRVIANLLMVSKLRLDCPLTSIEWLGKLPRLKTLRLGRCQQIDIRCVGELESVVELEFSGCSFANATSQSDNCDRNMSVVILKFDKCAGVTAGMIEYFEAIEEIEIWNTEVKGLQDEVSQSLRRCRLEGSSVAYYSAFLESPDLRVMSVSGRYVPVNIECLYRAVVLEGKSYDVNVSGVFSKDQAWMVGELKSRANVRIRCYFWVD